MALIYNVVDSSGRRTTYSGFKRWNNHCVTVPADCSLVVCWTEGEPDLFLVDGTAGMTALLRYLRDEGFPVSLTQTFQQVPNL